MSADRAAAIAYIRELANQLPDAGEQQALNSLAEIIAYQVATARAEGQDEIERIELLMAVAEPSRELLREAERTLRVLGYVAVADLLRRLVRKAKPSARRKSWRDARIAR